MGWLNLVSEGGMTECFSLETLSNFGQGSNCFSELSILLVRERDLLLNTLTPPVQAYGTPK